MDMFRHMCRLKEDKEKSVMHDAFDQIQHTDTTYMAYAYLTLDG
jgi:hypothetical protein